MSTEQNELLEALAGLIDLITSGRHYKTQNPYTRPEVKAALIAYGKMTGQLPADFDPAGWMRDGSKHWMDVDYPQQDKE